MEGAGLDIPGYSVHKKIGTGSFATVFLARRRVRNRLKGGEASRFTTSTKDSLEEVAIKIINKTRLNEKLQEGLSSEIKTMSSITHENIVRLLDIQVATGLFIRK